MTRSSRGSYTIAEEIHHSLHCIYTASNLLMNKFVGLKGNVDISIDFVMKSCIMCNIHWGGWLKLPGIQPGLCDSPCLVIQSTQRKLGIFKIAGLCKVFL